MENSRPKESPIIKLRGLKIFHQSIEVVLVVLLIIVILIGGIILLFGNRATNDTNSDTNDLLEGFPTSGYNQTQVLEVKDEKFIEAGGVKVELPGGWRNSIILKDFTRHNDLKCKDIDQVDCVAFVITNGTQEFYISSPSSLVSADASPTFLEDKVVNEVQLNYERFKLVAIDGSTGEEIEQIDKFLYKDIYGCVDGRKLCISSGLLSMDIEINKQTVRLFEDLVNSLIVASLD